MGYDVFHSMSIFYPRIPRVEIKHLLGLITLELGQFENGGGGERPVLNLERLSSCMSGECQGGEGYVVVVAGIFKGWLIDSGFAVSKELSRRIRGTVCHTAIDLAVHDEMRTQVFRNGFATYPCAAVYPDFWPGPKVADVPTRG